MHLLSILSSFEDFTEYIAFTEFLSNMQHVTDTPFLIQVGDIDCISLYSVNIVSHLPSVVA